MMRMKGYSLGTCINDTLVYTNTFPIMSIHIIMKLCEKDTNNIHAGPMQRRFDRVRSTM